jgi:hypothetical protein
MRGTNTHIYKKLSLWGLRWIFFAWLKYLAEARYIDLCGQDIGLIFCPGLVLLVCSSFRLVSVFPAKLLMRSGGSWKKKVSGSVPCRWLWQTKSQWPILGKLWWVIANLHPGESSFRTLCCSLVRLLLVFHFLARDLISHDWEFKESISQIIPAELVPSSILLVLL